MREIADDIENKKKPLYRRCRSATTPPSGTPAAAAAASRRHASCRPLTACPPALRDLEIAELPSVPDDGGESGNTRLAPTNIRYNETRPTELFQRLEHVPTGPVCQQLRSNALQIIIMPHRNTTNIISNVTDRHYQFVVLRVSIDYNDRYRCQRHHECL